jgi:1-acyl-sn-glycerol-3-phosphate acyltransferase
MAFGFAGLAMSLIVLPLLIIIIRNRDVRQSVARAIIGKAFAAFIWLLKSLGVVSYGIAGSEHIRPASNQLIIANHPSLIDVVFLVSLFPQVDCVVKEGVVRNPFMRGTARAANYISNDAPDELLQECISRLESGGRLLLFPEGTRSVPGAPIELKLGAAAIAIRANSEILPITIQCIPPTLAKGVPWYQIPETRPYFAIRIFAPVSIEELSRGDSNCRQATRALTKTFESLLSHPDELAKHR